MSDNVRTALYDADYSVHPRVPVRRTPPPALCRVVGKHCESGDIIVKDAFLPADVHPGDLLAVPATGAYCRSHREQLQPRRRGRRSSRSGTARRG